MQKKTAQMLKKTLPLGLLPFLLYLAAVLYLRLLAPVMPPCWLRLLTGWRCPSCGMTHSAAALMRGDLAGAFRANLMLPFGVLALALLYAERWLDALGHPRRLLPRRLGFWLGTLALCSAYTVLRNL